MFKKMAIVYFVLLLLLVLVTPIANGEQIVNETGWLKVYYLSIYPEPVHENKLNEMGGWYPWLYHYTKRCGDFYYIEEGINRDIGSGWVYFPESVAEGDSHSGSLLTENDIIDMLGTGNSFIYWYGEQSESLKEIQAKLQQYRHSDEVTPDDWWYVNITGIYDDATTSAVRSFQQTNYLPPTGLLDKKTLAYFNSYYNLCTEGADKTIRLDKDAVFTKDIVEGYGNLEPFWAHERDLSNSDICPIESAYTVNGITWYGINPVTYLKNPFLSDMGMSYVCSHLLSFDGDEQFKPTIGVETDVINGTDAPTITYLNLNDIITKLISYLEYATGVRVRINNTLLEGTNIPSTDKAILEAEMQKIGATAGVWFDLSLCKNLSDGSNIGVHDTNEPLKFTLSIPERLKKAKRTFYLLSAHSGKATLLGSTTNNLLEAATDQFSTFVIAYKDAEEPITEPTKAPTAESTSVPKTGDTSTPSLWLGLILFGILGIIGIVAVSQKKQ